jgi:zinc finger protein
MNRRVIKSENATIIVPFCDLEIPPMTQKGKLTTIEGFISVSRDQLKGALDEGVYEQLPQESIEKIKSIIQKMDDLLSFNNFPFQFILDDPSGNSFIENPYAPQTDPNIQVSYFERTKEMSEAMGYMVQPTSNEPSENQPIQTSMQEFKKEFVQPSYYDKKKDFSVYKSQSLISAHLIDFTKSVDNNENIKEEAIRFPANCYCCSAPGETYMCICTIPFFKEIIIICFKCQHCGYKTTEIKGGGGISEKATRYTLKVTEPEDLNRDMFKSETSKIIIPELEFETDTGSMGSMYTTVEGVIDKIITGLEDIPFSHGDSCEDDSIQNFIKKLKALIDDKVPFTLILDDPVSNSFIQSPFHPEPDPRMIKEEYERTWQQNEDLGINDMKIENYGEK